MRRLPARYPAHNGTVEPLVSRDGEHEGHVASRRCPRVAGAASSGACRWRLEESSTPRQIRQARRAFRDVNETQARGTDTPAAEDRVRCDGRVLEDGRRGSPRTVRRKEALARIGADDPLGAAPHGKPAVSRRAADRRPREGKKRACIESVWGGTGGGRMGSPMSTDSDQEPRAPIEGVRIHP